jgi:hypothetical protein
MEISTFLCLKSAQRIVIEQQEKKALTTFVKALILFGSGERIRTSDLWVMSPTSYQTAPPRDMAIFKTGEFTPLSPIFVKELFWLRLLI